MMLSGLSGFYNAPVTGVIVVSSAFLTLVSGFRGRRLGLSYQDIKDLNLGRVIPSVIAFSSSPELVFALFLLYYFRVFERQNGSNKYSVFALFSLIVSTSLQVLALTLLKDPTLVLASGPYGLIFASFVPFYFDIPVTSWFHVFGLKLSDKAGIYLAGLQLLLSFGKRSLVPGICGILAGCLYRMNVFGILRLKFPASIATFFSRILFSSSPSSSHASRVQTRYAGHQIQRNYPSIARVSVPEPPESSIATLVSMGFDSNAARQALMRARNDINVATNILLEAQSR